jgi:hypothetical protein
MSLITVSEFKEYQAVVSKDNDTLITSLVGRVDSLVKKYLGREIESASSTEIHDEFRDTLILKKFPVIALTSITINGAVLTVTEDYVFDASTGIVYNMSGWRTARRGVVVVYTHGYFTVPSDIKLACLELCKFYYSHMNSPENSDETILNTFNLLSKSTNGVDLDFDTLETLKRIKGILSPYRPQRIS